MPDNLMQTVKIDRTKVWTLDDYLMLGEMNTPCQLINGELILSPSPTPYHQTILSNLNDLLKTEAKKTGGIVFFAPMDLHIDRRNVFQPDLIYISKENKHIITQRAIEGVPDLVVEIISPSNIFSDRYTKKRVYQKIGIGEYWIVDPANRTLEIFLSSQADPDVPHLYVVGEGPVTSTVIPSLEFDLKSIL
jgi:Uma2 family endonuclease